MSIKRILMILIKIVSKIEIRIQNIIVMTKIKMIYVIKMKMILTKIVMRLSQCC